MRKHNRKDQPIIKHNISYWKIIKKTSLHLISAVSADITSGITSNITSAVGWKS